MVRDDYDDDHDDDRDDSHRLLQLGVWGCCKPPVGPLQSPAGGARAKLPEALKNLQFTIPRVMFTEAFLSELFSNWNGNICT